MNETSPNYSDLLAEIKTVIVQARLKAVLSVNAQLIALYWQLGSRILQNQAAEGWGSKVVERLAADLRLDFPDMKGFSVRNLNYMRKFAAAYPDFAIVQTVSA